MNFSRSLPLRLRGDRNYFHGTDLFNSIHDAFSECLGDGALSRIHFKIPRFFTRPVLLEIAPSFESGAVVWNCRHVEKNWQGRLLEDPSASLPAQFAFDESAFCQSMRIEGGEAICVAGDASAIESVVFLTKFQHQKKYPGQRWVFSRLELDRTLSDLTGQELKIKTVATLDSVFTKNEIVAEQEVLGHVFFSRLEEKQT